MPLPTSAASPPTSVSSSTRSISMSPESARPRTAGASMPGLHCSRSLAAPPASRWAKDRITPEHVVDVVGLRVAELADRLVQRARQRPAQPLVGAGLELAGAPAAGGRRRAQGVEQHGLADAAQPGEHQAALGAAARRPVRGRRRRRAAARRGRRARAGAGRRRARRGSGSGPRLGPIGESSAHPRLCYRRVDSDGRRTPRVARSRSHGRRVRRRWPAGSAASGPAADGVGATS